MTVLVTFIFAAAVFSAVSPDLNGFQVFPADNPWNWDISNYAVHPNSDNYVAGVSVTAKLHPDFGTVYGGAPIGIPYVVVNAGQSKIPINFTAYGDESDPGPYPVPLSAPVEGGLQSTGDRHVIAVDTSAKKLYELYSAYPQAAEWDAACGAVFDLAANTLRPEGWTSADAAGLPVFPGLVRYEEVYVKHRVDHAIRMTVQNSQRAYLWPARHYASSSTNANLAPMGLRFRLKASFDTAGFSEPVRVILVAMKKHGLIVADNGSNWYISGAPDDRWDDNVLGELKNIAGSNFEAVLTVDTKGNPITPAPAVEKKAPSLAGPGRLQVVPNPFRGSTQIGFDANGNLRPGSGCLAVYDMGGRRVRAWEGFRALSNGVIKWDGRDSDGRALESGAYFVHLSLDGRSYSRTVILMK